MHWRINLFISRLLEDQDTLISYQENPYHDEFIWNEVLIWHVCCFCCTGDPDVILKCIVSGFFANAARIHHSGSYRWGINYMSNFNKQEEFRSHITLLFVFFSELYVMIVNFTSILILSCLERSLQNGQSNYFYFYFF